MGVLYNRVTSRYELAEHDILVSPAPILYIDDHTVIQSMCQLGTHGLLILSGICETFAM